MKLSDLEINVPARITSIDSTPGVIERLHSVGIFVGSCIETRYRSHAGRPVCVATEHDCTFALGYGLAEKIFISKE